MPMHEVLGCMHEKELGEIVADRRRWETHMSSTEKKLDELAKDIKEINLTLTGYAASIASVSTIKDSILGLTKQIASDRKDNQDSLKRAHERIDDIMKSFKDHSEDHCEGCRHSNTLNEQEKRCQEVTEELEEIKTELEPLRPLAKAIAKVRDNIFFWLIISILLVSAWFFVTAANSQYGIKPPINIEGKK